ncbi:fimbrial protein [Enterobacter vonholyi]
MKKIIAISALMAAMASANALAADANLTFNGAVSTGTCTMNSADATKTLTIPDVSISALTAVGAVAYGTINANTTVGFTGCPSTTSYVNVESVTSTGAIFNNSNVLASPASGTATGVHLIFSVGPGVTNYVAIDGSTITNRQFAVNSQGNATVPIYVGVRANQSVLSSSADPTSGTYSNSYTVTFTYS